MRCKRVEERARRGFTMIELLVSVVVAAAAVLVTLLLAHGMTQQLRTAHQTVGASDNARVAIDEITRTLRGAGSGTDYTNGQDRFVYADAFTIALNANLLPFNDPAGTGAPTAIDATLADASVPLSGGLTYTPPRTFSTGAETIVLTLDSNRDGQIATADASDDAEEESENPNDYVLKAYAYGKSGGQNAVTTTGLAVLRGPGGTDPVEPLFRYWIDGDNDPSTAAVLHGDSNSDGTLSDTEIAGLDALSAGELPLIERVDITATAEPEKPRHGTTYPKTLLRSSVSFRNRTNTATHVVGTVFHDVDRDGIRDADELGIRDVIVLCSNSTRTKTNIEGQYQFVLNPGIYTISEINPFNYTSTTPDQVQVNAAPDDWATVDFGDLSRSGTGRILGTVFSDENSDGVHDAGERGLSGIEIFLDNGSTTHTNSDGRYNFTVPIQDYVVTEVDSMGYISITPNVVDVNLQANGDSVVVDFADHKLEAPGFIHGIVFADIDNDGIKDLLEVGVPNVTISVDDTYHTNTDARGEYSFSVQPGTHQVVETDPAGFTSSTVNNVDILVVTRQTVQVNFGDIPQQDISFQEITLGNTERALSIASFDTGEDTKSDMDIVLGTHYVGGRNDILVWWNKRNNSSTPNSALFSTNSSYQRVIAADVNAVAVRDMNRDSHDDIVTALGMSGNNVAVWLTGASGAARGQLPNSPSAAYSAAGMIASDVVMGTFDANSIPDLVVGTKTSSLSGNVEVWHGQGGSGFSRSGSDVMTVVPGTGNNWGEVTSLAAADFNADGRTDFAVGARTGSNSSNIYVVLYGPGQVTGSDFYLQATIPIVGLITDVLALDMKEDNQNDVDLVVGIETASSAGRIELWNNRGDNHFGTGDTAETAPDDSADPGGSPLSLTAAKIDNDVYPDIAVGTRIGLYSGKVGIYRSFGYLPSSPQIISATDVGEVITMTTADYNKDGAPDLAVGTRTGSTAGKVVIYFNTRQSL